MRLTLPLTTAGVLTTSPIPLEPEDAVARSARRVVPYARARVERPAPAVPAAPTRTEVPREPTPDEAGARR